MMLRKKLGLSLLLALVLVVSAAVAVGAYEPRPGVLSPDEVDFGGKTVTVIVRDLDWVVHNGGKPTEERIAEAEALFNVKIETGTFNNIEELQSRIMANDSAYDIFRFNHRSGYFQLLAAGMLLPMSEYLPDEYFEALPASDRYTIEKLSYGGEYYGFGVVYGLFNGSMMILRYPLELIEEAGLEDPYQLWLEDRWDYQVFEEYLIALTQDTDGDGVNDQFGMFDVGNAIAAYRFMPFNGAEVAKKDENGKWVYSLGDSDAINALNLITRWKELGVMGSGGDEKTGFQSSHLAGMRHAIAKGIPLGYVPFPKGPDVDRYQFPVFDFTTNMLPVNSAYPEGMIALVDFLFRYEDTEEYLDFYVNSYMQSREQLDVYMAGAEGWRGEGDMFQSSGLWDITNPAVTPIVNLEKGVAAGVDEVRPEAQAWLDDFFRQ